MADLVTRLLLNKSNFDSNIQASARELMDMKKKAERLSKGIDNVGASFGRMAGAMGLAMTASDMFTQVVGRMKELVQEGVEMARSSEGIAHAFEALNRPDLLQGLRDATHGTVNDLELMKAAVQANDFRIPLENLGKYMEFAQLKASQTGQSVDFLTQSIVTGLGRQSKQILDNLGISAAELDEKMAEGATMAEAVGQIIDTQLAAAGDHFETAAERAGKAATDLANAQMELGKTLLPMWDNASSALTQLEIKILRFTNKVVTSAQEGGAAWEIFFGYLQDEAIASLGPLGKVVDTMLYLKGLASDILSSGNESNGVRGIEMDDSKEKANKKMLDALMEQDIAKKKRKTTYTPRTTPRRSTTSRGSTETPAPVGSMAYNEKQISNLQQQLKLKTNPEDIAKIQKQIDDFKAKNESMEIQAKMILQGSGKGAGVSDTKGMMDDLHKEIVKKSSVIGKDMEDVAYKMQLPMVQTMRKMKGFETKVLEPYKQFSENAGEIVKGVQGIDMMVSSIGNLVTSIENGANAWEIFMGVVNTVSSVIQGIGMVMETVNTIMELTGTTATTTASQQAAASGTVIAAKTGEAIAGAAAGGAMMPFPYSLIAIAAGIAAVLAALSMIGGFAEGGTVGGSSWTGDKLLARVNSGERILPAKKAKALDDMMAAGPAVVIPDVRLRGSDLWLSFNNENKLRSKAGRGFKG